MEVTIDEVAINCLEQYREVRDQLAGQLSIPIPDMYYLRVVRPDPGLVPGPSLLSPPGEGLLGLQPGASASTSAATTTSSSSSSSSHHALENSLLVEANCLIDLAEIQFGCSMRAEACRNFHSATVYYRVLETVMPSLAGATRDRLRLAVSRTRITSTFVSNFVQEHFSGASCSEYYEVNGKNKLGKG